MISKAELGWVFLCVCSTKFSSMLFAEIYEMFNVQEDYTNDAMINKLYMNRFQH